MNKISSKTAAFYISGVYQMLKYLHNHSIIYRDIKPENIIICKDGYPKLIDFGSAKIISGRTYSFLGTPHYMAPEVILGKGYSFQSDYWSLGILLYELVTGILPFGEELEEPFEIYQAILQTKLAFPDWIKPNIKSRSTIEHLLTKSSAARGDGAFME